ncbi:hypothetical protein GQ457_01G047820 [Hibiscus cannabinus]
MEFTVLFDSKNEDCEEGENPTHFIVSGSHFTHTCVQIQQPSSQNGSASVDVGVGCRSVASRHESSAGIPLPPAVDVHQGILDEQFLQLQQLQDESSPNFVSEVVNIYFHESEKLLRSLRSLLMDREFSDYNKMGIHLNQFMGSSSSIGANRIRNVCVAFRAASEQNNRAGCLRALELLEHEYCFLKNKLHELFQIEQQRVLAAGVRYPMQNI